MANWNSNGDGLHRIRLTMTMNDSDLGVYLLGSFQYDLSSLPKPQRELVNVFCQILHLGWQSHLTTKLNCHANRKPLSAVQKFLMQTPLGVPLVGLIGDVPDWLTARGEGHQFNYLLLIRRTSELLHNNGKLYI